MKQNPFSWPKGRRGRYHFRPLIACPPRPSISLSACCICRPPLLRIHMSLNGRLDSKMNPFPLVSVYSCPLLLWFRFSAPAPDADLGGTGASWPWSRGPACESVWSPSDMEKNVFVLQVIAIQDTNTCWAAFPSPPPPPISPPALGAWR